MVYIRNKRMKKHDWLGLSSSFSSMYLKRELNISLSKPLPNIDKSKTGQSFFMRSFSPFYVNWNNIAFFQKIGKAFLSLQFLNMIESGFTILLSQSFNILMDTSSCSWTLLIASVLIILYISSSSTSKDDSFVSLIYVWFTVIC